MEEAGCDDSVPSIATGLSRASTSQTDRKERHRVTQYQRVLLKLSGEEFGGGRLGVDPDVVSRIAREIASVCAATLRANCSTSSSNFTTRSLS